MKNLEWVIDTWVLGTANDYNKGQLALDSISFLNEVLKNHCIGIDFEGEIVKEYKKHIRLGTHISSWFNLIVKKGKISYRSGKLSHAHRTFLIDNLFFHDDDIKFVAVAYNGPNKYLTSEDSDYTEQIKEYLSANLSVKVFTIEEALNTTQKP